MYVCLHLCFLSCKHLDFSIDGAGKNKFISLQISTLQEFLLLYNNQLLLKIWLETFAKLKDNGSRYIYIKYQTVILIVNFVGVSWTSIYIQPQSYISYICINHNVILIKSFINSIVELLQSPVKLEMSIVFSYYAFSSLHD